MEKIRILCFGDSLTWGYHPVKRIRYGEEERWTGILQELLGEKYKVIEEGQNSRTIATEDPTEGEKNGLAYILPCLESQRPLDLMILMLGTNDMKRKYGYSAEDIAGEMERFLEKVWVYNHFHLADAMKILMIGPEFTQVVIKTEKAASQLKWIRSEKITKLDEAYRRAEQEKYDAAFAEVLQEILGDE